MMFIDLKESCLILSLELLIQGMKCVSYSNNICRQHFFKLTCVIGFSCPVSWAFISVVRNEGKMEEKQNLNLLRFWKKRINFLLISCSC